MKKLTTILMLFLATTVFSQTHYNIMESFDELGKVGEIPVNVNVYYNRPEADIQISTGDGSLYQYDVISDVKRGQLENGVRYEARIIKDTYTGEESSFIMTEKGDISLYSEGRNTIIFRK